MKICTIAGRTADNLPWGHDESHPDCVALKLTLLEKVAELVARGVTVFMTNCEYGVPLFAAEAVLALRESLDIELNIIMPLETMANSYSREVRERFFDIHAAADSVEILSKHEHDCCFMAADMLMVHYSGLLLTDSEDSFIADYAKKKGKRIEFF